MTEDIQVPPRHGEGDHAKRGGGGSRPSQRPVVYTARKLRREQSLPEGMLWKRLRSNQLGMKFRRQHPIGPYVVDFYCSCARLVIEIDGAAHDNEERTRHDAGLDQSLAESGYDILRLTAAQVLANLDEAVAIIAARAASPLHRPADGPPPRAGEAL